MICLRDIIIKSAQAGIKMQRDDGSFPPGHNGSWNVPETPVRNTSHWLITCAKAYQLTDDISFKKAVKNAGTYLLGSSARPFNHTFHIMKQNGWATNGIVGQAWVMEALLAAYHAIKNDQYLEVAHDLVKKHSFNEELSLWNITALEGEVVREHTTLNQQIWFTALAHQVGIITNDIELLEKTAFLANNLPDISKFNGKFIHMIVNEKIYMNTDFKSCLQWKWKFLKNRTHFDALSKGYISYSLYPLAILYEVDQSLHLWNTKSFKNLYLPSFRYMEEYIFEYLPEDNPYAFTYHPTGFEAAFILESFSGFLVQSKRSKKDWITRQLNRHYDFQENLMCKNTCDPNTLSARLYEVTRLKDLDVEVG